ncbi:MAG: hypothetical protein U0T74_08045 [Chitinophagales bacterium]
MSNSRISPKPAVFNSYLNNTDDYLQATAPGSSSKNWERLGLSATQAAQWQQQRQYWRNTLYPAYSSPDQCTKTVRKEVVQFIKQFSAFALPLLNLMAACPAVNAQDSLTFNFALKRKAPTHHRVPVTELCYGSFTPQGSGRIKAGFRTLQNSGRPALAQGANCVQIAYSIGEPAPTHAGEAARLDIVPRASYVIETSPAHAGKWLYIFSRWYNSKHPQLAGPWSQAMQVMVL